MRLDLMAGEDLADRALDDARHAGMSGGGGMLADVARQQARGPELVRIPKVLGLLAGQGHQPRAGLWCDPRRLAGPRAVIKRRHHPEPQHATQAALHGVTRNPDLLAHRGRRRVRAIGQQNPRPFHPARRFRSRSRHHFKSRKIVFSNRDLDHSPRGCHGAVPTCPDAEFGSAYNMWCPQGNPTQQIGFTESQY